MERVGAYTDRVTEGGEWRPGNPASGQQATPMLADYFNMVQRELVNVVEGSEIELDGEDDGQLLRAIKKQAEAVSPVATQAEALVTDEAEADNVKRMTPLRVLQAIKARLINASEVVVGMLRVGTQDEVNAGTLDTVAVTPKKLRFGFLINLATNGYIAFPAWLGGLIIQWGRIVSPGTNANTVVPLQLALPNAALFGGGSFESDSNQVVVVGYTSTTQITIRADEVANSGAASVPLRWFLFGY